MHQKDLAREAWRKAGFYRTRDPALRDFIDHFERQDEECWPDLVEAVRAICPNHKETLAVPLWNTGDPLIRVSLLRFADLTQPDERTLVDRLLTRADSRRDERELFEAARLGDLGILDIIARRRVISDDLRAVVTLHRARLAEPGP